VNFRLCPRRNSNPLASAAVCDTQKRWSVLYELTPIPFVQLRAGWRRYDGDSRVDFENTSLLFLEVHGFSSVLAFLAGVPALGRKAHAH